MKKTSKKICVVLALVLAILMLASNLTFAKPSYSELDPNSWITLPMMITGKTAHITVSSSAGAYTLYYQIQYLTDTQFSSFETKQRTLKTELEKKKEAAETKTAELNTIIDQYNKEQQENGTVSEATKQAYAIAKAAAEAAVKDYRDYAEAAQEEIMAIIPDFVEADWTQSTDGTIQLDYGNKTGAVHFVLWAKLVAGGATSYDMTVYSTTITGEESVAITESTLSVKVGESKTLTVTHSGGTQALVWESSDETIAEVNDNGMVTGIREGTATITVKLADGSSRDTCTVTVTKESSGGNGNTNQPPQGNIVIPGTSNNTTNGGGSTNTNTAGNKPTGVTGNMDNTKASGKIPQTGANSTIILIVAGFAVAGGFCYYKYRKYNF